MAMLLCRRLVQALAVMLAVTLLAFFMFRYAGDPVVGLLGQDATPQQRQQLRADLGLDQSPLVQFLSFVERAARGDFGFSLQQGRPVFALIAERLPATLELSLVSSLLAVVLGIPLGALAGVSPGRIRSQTLMLLSLLGVSVPSFLVGTALIALFAVTLGWLPSFGRGEVVQFTHWNTGLLTLDGWRHMLLPALTLAFFQLALIARMVRSEMLAILRAEHIRFAFARGLSPWAIYFRHALKNTMVSVLTVLGLQLGSVLAFSIITESVFQWPGMGLLLIQSIQSVDVPVMAAYLCLVALMFVVIHAVVDMLYHWVDPRLRAH